jgi:hypothetical protein
VIEMLNDESPAAANGEARMLKRGPEQDNGSTPVPHRDRALVRAVVAAMSELICDEARRYPVADDEAPIPYERRAIYRRLLDAVLDAAAQGAR